MNVVPGIFMKEKKSSSEEEGEIGPCGDRMLYVSHITPTISHNEILRFNIEWRLF
jgi:hypothetical protein